VILDSRVEHFSLDTNAVLIGDKDTVARGFGSKGGDQGKGMGREIFFGLHELFVWSLK